MKKFIPARIIAASAVLLSSLFVLLAYAVPMDKLYDALNGAIVGVSVVLCFVYARIFWQSVVRIDDRVNLLALGFGLLWASFIGLRLISATYRAAGKADELLNNPLVAFMIYVGLIAAILQVAAPGYPPAGFKVNFGGRHRWYILAAVILGATGALAMTEVGIFGN